MTTYRLVALDMDGTLLASDGSLSPRVTRAVRAARERGVAIALATARRWVGVLPVARELGLDGPLILYDGAIVRSFPDGKAQMSHALDVALAQRAAETLAAHELQVVTQHSSPHGERMAVSENPLHPKWMRDYLENFRDQATYVPLARIARRFPNTLRVVSFGPESRLRDAIASLGDAPVGRQILPMGSYGIAELTVFSPRASKGEGLRWLAQHLGIPLEQTLAIGDGVNDISMLREAGLGVAMGNAARETQEAARVVTATNDEDGAALAIERYVLEGERVVESAEETA